MNTPTTTTEITDDLKKLLEQLEENTRKIISLTESFQLTFQRIYIQNGNQDDNDDETNKE